MPDPTAKIKPPFTSLSSFNISAIVLSYLDFADSVGELLALLSRDSRNYVVSHAAILNEFLIKRSILRKIPGFFGNQTLFNSDKCTAFEWPTQ